MKWIVPLLFCALCASTAAGQAAGGIRRIAADETSLRVEVRPSDEPRGLVELAAWEGDDAPGKPVAAVAAGQTTVSLDRRTDDQGDRLYRRFVLRNAAGENLSPPHWTTDLSATTRRAADLTWPKSIKGVSNPMDTADLVDLGIRHVHTNVGIGNAFLPPGKIAADPEFRCENDGRTYHFDADYFHALDREYRELTAAGINVVVVVLNPFLSDPALSKALTHPDADRGAFYSAFRLDNADSVARYTAFLRFFAERYTRDGFPNGRVGGLIIGNEIDTHWTWHNMGPADADAVAHHHALELRLAELAVRQAHPTLPIFTSLTHSWTWANSLDKQRNTPSKYLLDSLVEIGRDGGDFDWNVAYHPYPKNLYDPKFWNDKTAVFAYDTPQITFKNIEVLAAYLAKDRMRYDGKPRRLILSEQGLDAGKGPAGEKLQAEALALAWEKIEKLPAVDALILHRHLDHPKEAGLRLGLLALDSDEEADMTDKTKRRRRPAWHVYQAAGTPAFKKVAKPYLEALGPAAIAAATPPPRPFPETSPKEKKQRQGDDVVFDLAELSPSATVTNQLAWNRELVDLPDGGVRDALMLHPLGGDKPDAEATFTLDLPAAKALELRFTTGKRAPGGDGYVAAVLVDGKQLWQGRQPDQAMADHAVDLSKYAGKSITLTFRVGKGGDERYDNALLIAPRIVRP